MYTCGWFTLLPWRNQHNCKTIILQLKVNLKINPFLGEEDGGRFKREGIYVYLWLIHVEVWQKATKFCKAIILWLKNKLIKKKKHPSLFSWTQVKTKQGSRVGTWHVPLLGWPGVEASGFPSWEPIRSDSREHWVSKEALGKSSASLYPYQCFPAQHLGASADRFLMSNRMGRSGPSDAITHVFPSCTSTPAVWPWASDFDLWRLESLVHKTVPRLGCTLKSLQECLKVQMPRTYPRPKKSEFPRWKTSLKGKWSSSTHRNESTEINHGNV